MPEAQKKKNELNFRLILSTRQSLLLAIFFLLLSALLIIFFIIPQAQTALDLRGELQLEQRSLESLKTKQANLTQVASSQIYRQKDQIHSILPSQKPVLSILRELEKASGEAGVIISQVGVVPGDISTSSAEAKKDTGQAAKRSLEGLPKEIDVIETDIVVAGTIDQINTFLTFVNQIVPLTETTGLTLKAVSRKDLNVEANENLELFEAGLSLTSFFYLGRPVAQTERSLPKAVTIDEETRVLISTFRYPSFAPAPPPTIEGGGKEDLFE